jgi:hypothetical protein
MVSVIGHEHTLVVSNLQPLCTFCLAVVVCARGLLGLGSAERGRADLFFIIQMNSLLEVGNLLH